MNWPDSLYLIDTNIYVAALLENFLKDSSLKEYVKFYRQIIPPYRILPDFILTEFEKVLSRVVPRKYKLTEGQKSLLKEVAFEFLKEAVANFTLSSPSEEEIRIALQIYDQNRLNFYISFTDCLLLSVAEENQYTLLTADKEIISVAEEKKIPIHKVC